MYNAILICGTTASGKSDLSITLALRYGGEIINCDSQQIYKHFDIGTAKPSASDFQKVKHHLFDYVDITEGYSVSRYHSDAMEVFNNLTLQNILPIFVGGTGLYIDSLMYSQQYGFVSNDDSIRQKYVALAKTYGNEYLHNLLRKVDPISADTLHPNDVKRVVRALEIAESGHKKSSQKQIPNKDFRPFVIYCDIEREILYERINTRVDIMMQNGLFDEVQNLKQNGLLDKSLKLPIGYSEWLNYYDGTLDFDQTVSLIKQHSRNYAKRQKTWFRKRNFAVEYNPLHNTMQSLLDNTDLYFKKK